MMPKGVMFYAVVAAVILIGGCGMGVEAGSMEDTVKDLYDAPSERQARFFLNYDRSAAFNTSVAFTIPLFSFTLPGAGDTSAAGLDLQAFGALAFVALFLLGGLAVAIYTTTQAATGRTMRGFPSASSSPEGLAANVMEALEGLPNVIDTKSCAQLAICGVYAEPEKYGLLAWPLKYIVPSAAGLPVEELSEYQKAARIGEETEMDCQYSFPCLLQPMDLLLYIYDYWQGEGESEEEA